MNIVGRLYARAKVLDHIGLARSWVLWHLKLFVVVVKRDRRTMQLFLNWAPSEFQISSNADT